MSKIPRKPGYVPGKSSSTSLPRLSALSRSVGGGHMHLFQKRLSLRPRMGLLKDKAPDTQLSDVEMKMLDHELAIAGEIQQNLLPKKIPKLPGYDIGAYYKPSSEVGGDYYDFIEIDAEHLGILVADVSGKGIPGAIVMTMTRTLIRSEAPRTLSTAETLIRVNRFLAQDIKRGMFVTVMYMILSPQRGTLSVTSAGHNPMVLWRNASNTCHLVNPNGLALGIDKGPLFERTIKEQKIQLFRGDRFVAYTDGVIESMNNQSEMLGPNRVYLLVKQLAEKGSSEFTSLIAKVLEEHQGEADQHDDITMVTARYLPQA